MHYCELPFVQYIKQVHLQTQQEVVQGFVGTTVNVVRTHGFRALYNGLTASLTRQVSSTDCVDL